MSPRLFSADMSTGITAGSGVARGGKRGNCPPFFQGERVGGRAIYNIVTLGDEQTRRDTGYGD